MGDLTETDWWLAFTERLTDESLDLLAAEFSVSVEDLEKALAGLDDGDAITDTPGWSEIVRRVRAGRSIRQTARCFQTSPRRIRRGLARTAVRVAGVDVGADGHPAMEDIADDLGKIPDGVLARRCGVTVEAIQGERRRLGIDAFRPAPSPERAAARRKGLKLAAPKRAKPQKVWQREEVDTQVVHRPNKRRVGPGRTPAVSVPKPTTGFAKGLQLPTLKPSSGSTRSMGERGWSAPPSSGPDSTVSDGRGRTRRRVVRADADPIAAALGRKSASVETSSVTRPAKERTARRRRVARPARSSDKDGSDTGPPSDTNAPLYRSTGATNVSVVASLSTPGIVIPTATVHHLPVTPDSVDSGKRRASVSGDESLSSDASVAIAAVPSRDAFLPSVPGVPGLPSIALVAVPSVEVTRETPSHLSNSRSTRAVSNITSPAVSTPSAPLPANTARSEPAVKIVQHDRGSGTLQPASQHPSGATVREQIRRAPHKSATRTAPASAAAPRPIASLAAYRAALDGAKALLHKSIRVTEDGVYADRVPEIWKVRAGREVLPVVALCHSMLEAVLLVQTELDAAQMQNLSVWSDGALG